MFTSFASCDYLYFVQHAPALVASALFHGNNIHIHVLVADDATHEKVKDMEKQALKMKKNIGSLANVRFTVGPIPLEQKYLRDMRTYYACNRFIEAPIAIHELNTSLLVIDVDCYFMKPVVEPTNDVCLFLRESLPGTVGWEAEGTRVAAGAVYYANNLTGMQFANEVRDAIIEGEHRWFADQVALSRVFNEYKTYHDFNYGVFDGNFMDWEFRQGTTIWTGKGPRKYENPDYLKQKKVWDDMFWRMSQ